MAKNRRLVLADNHREPIETIALVRIGDAPEVNAERLLRPEDPAERPQRDLAAETILAELEDGEQPGKAITPVLCGRSGWTGKGPGY